jgi:hypothetical protein
MSAYMGERARFSLHGNLSRSEARRLGRYDSLVGQLSTGRLSGREFERRVGSWRPFRGEQLAGAARSREVFARIIIAYLNSAQQALIP